MTSVELVRLPDLERVQDHVERQLESGSRKVWVAADPGAGRTVLAERLCAQRSDRAFVSLLDLDEADAITHASQMLAAHAHLALGESSPASSSLPDMLARAHTQVILRVPGSWRPLAGLDDEWTMHRAAMGRGLLDGLWRHPDLHLVVLSERTLGLDSNPINLKTPDADPRALTADALWHKAAPSAHRLRAALKATNGLMPIPVRLAVGAIWLGAEPKLVAGIVLEPAAEAIPRLAGVVTSLLDQRPELARGLRRLLRLRRPVPSGMLPNWLGVSDDHVELFARCIGYGEPVRVPAQVRLAMRKWLLSAEEGASSDNAALGDEWNARDGAASPPVTNIGQLEAWFEKAHHYAHAGNERVTEWESLMLPAPELYWARGRSLSFARQFKDAADVYRRCVEQFPRDDYAWHYRAYNLQLAGIHHDDVEESYRKALEFSPQNAWWNSRLVTFLIQDARPGAARAEWPSAVRRADPSGEAMTRDPWLSEHLHRWVAKAWLDAGRSELAAEVIAAIPSYIVDQSGKLAMIEHAVQDAEEERLLGSAVYPFDIPTTERWAEEPQILPVFDEDGVDLLNWFPGRIIEANKELVRLVYVTPRRPPPEGRLVVAEIPADEWRGIGWGSAARAMGFVELGIYSNGQRRVVRRPGRARPEELRFDQTSLAFLESWLTNNPPVP